MWLRTTVIILIIIISILGCAAQGTGTDYEPDNLINNDNEFETSSSKKTDAFNQVKYIYPSEEATIELIQKINYELLSDLIIENQYVPDSEVYLVPSIRSSYSFSESVIIDSSCIYLDSYFRNYDNITKSNATMMILVAYEKSNNSENEIYVFNDIEFKLSDMSNEVIYSDNEVIVINVLELIDSDHLIKHINTLNNQSILMRFDWLTDINSILQEQRNNIIQEKVVDYNIYSDNPELIYFTLPEIAKEKIVIDEEILHFSIWSDYLSSGLGAEHGNYWEIEIAYKEKLYDVFKGYLTSGTISYYVVDVDSPIDKKIILNVVTDDMIKIVEIYSKNEMISIDNIYYENDLNIIKYETVLP